MTELIWTKDYEALSRAAADILFQTVQKNPNAVLVLATGGSPKLAYRLFCEKVLQSNTDISGVTFVKLDEWIGLSADDEATCEVFLQRELIRPLGVAESRFIHFNPEATDSKAECVRFRAAYAALKQVDLVVLGIGKNGHLGLNEPSDNLCGSVHTVTLAEKTKTHEMLTHTEASVTQGITMGLKEIFEGEKVMLLAAGAEKEHLCPYLTDDSISTQVPFTLLKLHRDCVCIADQTAFS